MPIYEYKCQLCGYQLEVMQKISASPLINCPKCDKNSLEKEISSTSFQLKGTGWYATDFKNNASPKKANEEGPNEESSQKKTAIEEKPISSTES
jgi:putative FmdB family regulatory protein